MAAGKAAPCFPARCPRASLTPLKLWLLLQLFCLSPHTERPCFLGGGQALLVQLKLLTATKQMQKEGCETARGLRHLSAAFKGSAVNQGSVPACPELLCGMSSTDLLSMSQAGAVRFSCSGSFQLRTTRCVAGALDYVTVPWRVPAMRGLCVPGLDSADGVSDHVSTSAVTPSWSPTLVSTMNCWISALSVLQAGQSCPEQPPFLPRCRAAVLCFVFCLPQCSANAN